MHARSALALAVGLSLLSCSERPTAPVVPLRPVPKGPLASTLPQLPIVVISQVYGGGGNAGSTYKNDFIELFNTTAQPVNVDGWSVQYASAAGTSWQVTLLSGTIQPGHYYLVQEAAQGGGTVALPAPDASGGIPMSATVGKVVVIAGPTPASGVCPASIVDGVSYGTTASLCFGPSRTPAPSNQNAVIRGDGGCKYTGDLSVDFTAAPPTPRNTASPMHAPCGGVPVGPLDHVVISGPATVNVGSTAQLTAVAQDAWNQPITTAAFAWSASDASVSVDGSGLVTGISTSTAPVTITATATDNEIVKFATAQISAVPPSINWVDVRLSSSSFPPGFQTQMFATAKTAQSGTEIPATFSFVAVDPGIATITTVQNTGMVTGVSPGRPGFQITAVPIGGGTAYTFTTHAITIETPVSADPAIYGTNDEFGDPTPANASDPADFLIVRRQYTLSYNQTHGTPNWVSYELDARQMAPGQDRCNCFTADPNLPAEKQIFTSDYTNGGFDRGHMARSADRTAANVDNASTFYLTNIVPQTADLNQGVWAQFENALADSANAGRAVYIITGPLYAAGHPLTFLKNEGKVAVPDSTWKVAFIGPRLSGLPFTRSTIQNWADLAGTTVLAVAMPNVAGVRNDPWSKYLTTVDRIERSTGFDFLSLLPVAFQSAIEAGDHAPSASFTVSGTLAEGSALTLDASASGDPDLQTPNPDWTESLAHAWDFGDGSARATDRVVSHTYAQDGSYTATLTVTDAHGWAATFTRTIVVANVPPAVAPLSGATLLMGETFTAMGSFTDPGADVWTATVNYGDGSGVADLALAGKSFTLSHRYTTAGAFTATVSVSDGAATGTTTAPIVVETPSQGVGHLVDAVGALGALGTGEANSLAAKLRAAQAQLRAGNGEPAANMLGAFVNELNALVNAGRLGVADVDPIVAYARRVISSIGA